MRVMTGGQATIGGPTGKKPLITAEAPPAPGVPAHQGREGGRRRSKTTNLIQHWHHQHQLASGDKQFIVVFLLNVFTDIQFALEHRARTWHVTEQPS